MFASQPSYDKFRWEVARYCEEQQNYIPIEGEIYPTKTSKGTYSRIKSAVQGRRTIQREGRSSMKQTMILAGILLAFALSLASCGGNNVNKSVLSEKDNDSIQKADATIHDDVEIPRSHLGIELGMSWVEAKRILLNNVTKGVDEDFDNVHNEIYIKNRGDWKGNWGEKYSDFSIEVFDGKVYAINLQPKDNPSEVVAAIKKKYPFNVEEREEYMYRSGYYGIRKRKSYSFSNGKTEIYLDDNSHTIRYRDVKLKNSKSAYWDKIEKESEKERDDNVNQQLSDY